VGGSSSAGSNSNFGSQGETYSQGSSKQELRLLLYHGQTGSYARDRLSTTLARSPLGGESPLISSKPVSG
jgi:hypothetical protein